MKGRGAVLIIYFQLETSPKESAHLSLPIALSCEISSPGSLAELLLLFIQLKLSIRRATGSCGELIEHGTLKFEEVILIFICVLFFFVKIPFNSNQQ